MKINKPHRRNWDSEFFGYEVYELINDDAIQDQLLNINNIDLIYWVRSSEYAQLQDFGAKLVDIKVLYSRIVTSQIPNDPNIVSFDSNDDYSKLVQLAIDSGAYSRFKIDSNFKNGEFEKLYKEWIKKSVNRDIADDVLIYKEQNEILGMVTASFKESVLTIGLIAVKEGHRGKMIGLKLLNAVNNSAVKHHCNKINVYTQKGNELACRFYEKAGFKLVTLEWIYHLWIKK